MSDSENEGIGTKLIGAVIVLAFVAFGVDVVLLGGRQLDMGGKNPVELAAGETTVRDFDVTDVGVHHDVSITPYVSGHSADQRYSFATEIVVFGPDSKELARMSDKRAHQRVRTLRFVPKVAGEHRVDFITREGDERADMEVSVNDRRVIVPFINNVSGLLD